MIRSTNRTIARVATCASRSLALGLVAASLLACGEERLPSGVTPTSPTGRIRFVNAVADPARADRLDVTVAGVPLAVNIAYGAAAPNTAVQPNPAPYYPVYVGSWPVVARRTADTTVTVLNQNVTIAEGTDYTVLAVGTSAGVSGVVLTDDNTAPAAGNVRLRLVHASPTSPAAVDVYATAVTTDISSATPSAANVAFRSGSAYLALPAGTYRVRVTAAGSKAPILDVTLPALASGAARTLVLLDRSAGGTPATSALLVDR